MFVVSDITAGFVELCLLIVAGSFISYVVVYKFYCFVLLLFIAIFLFTVSKYLFKVNCSMPEISRHSHTLQACSDYNKKAWLDAFSLAKSQSQQQQPQFMNSMLTPVTEHSQSNTTLPHMSK